MKTMKPASKPRIKSVPASAPSVRTAKLFRNGRSQAVRLPKEFRFEGNEVAIRRDEGTGEVVLASNVKSMARNLRNQQKDRNRSKSSSEFKSAEATPSNSVYPPPENNVGGPGQRRKLSLQELFTIFDQAQFPNEFFERNVHMPRELELF